MPLGFVFAAVFLWLARPTLASLGLSLLLVVPGVWLRGYAAGYVKKNAEVTQTGPYAHTRNPLYLGSMLIAFGFAGASKNWVIGVLLVGLFLAIYLPVIRSEEEYLREHFAGFDEYMRRVPRLIPRITPGMPVGVDGGAGGGFDRARYLKHREYNALIGSLAIYAALLIRLYLPAVLSRTRSLR